MVNARRVKNAVAPASRSRIRTLGRAAAEGRADTQDMCKLGVIVLIGMATLGGVARAEGPDVGGTPPADGQLVSRPGQHPLLNFPVTEVDLGPISDARRVTTAFRFSNASGRTVRLVVDGCHLCGLPATDKPGYGPGESGTVFIELDPVGRRGEVRGIGGIGVEGGMPGRPTPEGLVQLLVRAQVRPEVWIDPPEMMVPELVRREVRPLVFEVSGRSADLSRPFAITEASAGSEHAVLEVLPPSRVETADDRFTRYTLKLRLKPDAPLGPLALNVRIATSSEAAPVLHYPISTLVRGELVGEPDVVIVGTPAPGGAFAGSFVVRSRVDGEPMVVKEVDVAAAGLATGVVLDARPGPGGTSWTVWVRGIAPRREIMFDEVGVAVTGRTALGGEETIVVPLRMSVRLPPEPGR